MAEKRRQQDWANAAAGLRSFDAGVTLQSRASWSQGAAPSHSAGQHWIDLSSRAGRFVSGHSSRRGPRAEGFLPAEGPVLHPGGSDHYKTLQFSLLTQRQLVHDPRGSGFCFILKKYSRLRRSSGIQGQWYNFLQAGDKLAKTVTSAHLRGGKTVLVVRSLVSDVPTLASAFFLCGPTIPHLHLSPPLMSPSPFAPQTP